MAVSLVSLRHESPASRACRPARFAAPARRASSLGGSGGSGAVARAGALALAMLAGLGCVPTTEQRPSSVEAAHPPRLPPDGASAAHYREGVGPARQPGAEAEPPAAPGSATGAGPARAPAPPAASTEAPRAGYWHWDGQRHRWVAGAPEAAASALPFRRATPE